LALIVATASAVGLWTAFRPPPSGPAASSGLVSLPGAFDVAVGEGAVWVARHTGGDPTDQAGEIVRIDPETDRVLARMPLERVGPIAAGEGGVWVATYPDADGVASLVRIDPSTNGIGGRTTLPDLHYEVANGDRVFVPNDVAVGFGRVWVSTARGTVLSIDPTSGDVATQDGRAGTILGGLAVGTSSVWAWNDVVAPNAAVLRIDPDSGRFVGREGSPTEVMSAAADGLYLWISHEPIEQVAPGCQGSAAACSGINALLRIEPATDTGTVSGEWPKTPGVLAAADGLAYLGDRHGAVWEVGESSSRRVADLGTPIASLAIDRGILWVLTGDGLLRLPLESGG
jgi:hypothetical protein